MNFTAIKRRRVSEEVIDQIKQMLLNFTLKEGDRLPPERQLAQQFGVSRVPLREALFSLERAGLLRIRRGAGGGVFVSEPRVEPYAEFFSLMLQLGKASVQDLTEARLFLEPNVARLAAERASVEDLEKIEQTIIAYAERLKREVPRSFEDMHFHIRVAEASKNMVMNLTIRGLMSMLYESVSDLKFSIKDRRKSILTHKRIFEAIKATDPEKAFDLMTEHVSEMAAYWKK